MQSFLICCENAYLSKRSPQWPKPKLSFFGTFVSEAANQASALFGSQKSREHSSSRSRSVKFLSFWPSFCRSSPLSKEQSWTVSSGTVQPSVVKNQLSMSPPWHKGFVACMNTRLLSHPSPEPLLLSPRNNQSAVGTCWLHCLRTISTLGVRLDVFTVLCYEMVIRCMRPSWSC